MKILWKLLRQHISPAQLAGFAIANLIGLVVILAGLQFYNDVSPLFSGGKSLIGNDYLVVTKKVDTYRSLYSDNASFSDGELEDIKSQKFVSDLGCFVPSDFEVYATINFQNNRLATDLFFETVPDRFIDIDNESWKYEDGATVVPIILPRNYLDLYNFGFAQARSMPQLSEAIVTSIVFNLQIEGNGQIGNFQGNIVGFSDRLNTILVPESFMAYANATYGSGAEPRSSRVIVEVSNPADSEIATYFSSRGYVIAESGDNGGKTSFFLKVAVVIVAVIGLLISVLAFYILTLSIFLLLEKNLSKLQNLLLLGYRPFLLAMPYMLLVTVLNVVVTLLACGVVFFVRGFYVDALAPIFGDLSVAGTGITILAAFIFFVVASLLDAAVIYFKLRRIERKV